MVKIEHAVIAGRQFKAAGLTPSALLSNKAIKEAVDCMNDEVLPIGFRADDNRSGWFYNEKEKFAWLIPLSFVGLFLAFGLSDFAFAIGTIAGLLFSILALVFYLPVFALPRPARAPGTLPRSTHRRTVTDNQSVTNQLSEK